MAIKVINFNKKIIINFLFYFRYSKSSKGIYILIKLKLKYRIYILNDTIFSY